MKYALFDTMQGTVVDRTPEEVTDEILLEFEDVPDGCSAMVSAESGYSYYRKIDEDGKCVLPVMYGTLGVKVKRFGAKIDTWDCEGFKVIGMGGGRAIMYPANQNIHEELIRVLRENQQIRNEQKRLEGEILATNERLNKAFEGWGIT